MENRIGKWHETAHPLRFPESIGGHKDARTRVEMISVKARVMKRFLMMAAVVAGVSVAGLAGSAEAGYPGSGFSGYGRGYVIPNYVTHHGNYGGNYGSNYGGFGGANRGCWGGYRTLPARPVCKPSPYKYGNNCGNNYGYFGGYGRSNWNW